MLSRFKDEVVLVTGAAQGIGKNISAAFAREGAQVFIADINAKRGQAACGQLRRELLDVSFIHADLSKPAAAKAMVNAVVKKAKRLDILINNACAGERRGLGDEDLKNWNTGMSVNLSAAFFSSQEAFRVMAHHKRGCIVNIGSVAGSLTCHQSPNYHLAKAAVIQMTRYLAAFAGPLGVRVNCVSPGFIVKDEDRARFDRADNEEYRAIAKYCHPLRAVGACDDVARAVIFLCSDDARFITGQELVVDGGLTLQEQSGLVFRFHEQFRKGLRGTRIKK